MTGVPHTISVGSQPPSSGIPRKAPNLEEPWHRLPTLRRHASRSPTIEKSSSSRAPSKAGTVLVPNPVSAPLGGSSNAGVWIKGPSECLSRWSAMSSCIPGTAWVPKNLEFSCLYPSMKGRPPRTVGDGWPQKCPAATVPRTARTSKAMASSSRAPARDFRTSRQPNRKREAEPCEPWFLFCESQP